ncbi:MAG: Immunoglobulin-like protein [Proteobacteria bacterium]|nr:Immunoglobulin-like protein [Pseudomonadota bacterium]
MSRQQVKCRNLFALSAIALLCSAAVDAIAATPQVSMAPEHTVLLKADGSVWQWGVVDFVGARTSPGSNCYAQGAPKAAPAAVSGLAGIVAVAATGRNSIALKSDGTVWQWGLNAQLLASCPSGSIASAPTQVAAAAGPLQNVAAIWARSGSFFARKTDGSLWAWGNNEMNKLGAYAPAQTTRTTKPGASVQNIAQPLQVAHLKISTAGAWPPATPPMALTSGDTHTLALLYDGNIKAWGGGQYGERGSGAYGTGANPYWSGFAWTDWPAMTAISGVSSIAAGLYKSAAVKNDGTLWVWGCNQSGELGDGIDWGSNANILCERLPEPVNNLNGVAAVAMGDSHTTILKVDGTVWGMGYNGSGALAADNSVVRSLVPRQIPGLSGITAIDAAKNCSVAIKNDGTVWEWGVNCNGPNYRPVPPEQIGVGSVSAAPVCGSAQGRSFPSTPAANLCLIGAASAVTGAGPWNWSCGPAGGQTVSCTAGNGPVFVLDPVGGKVFPAGSITLKVIAQGSGTLTYQWYKTNAAGDKIQLTDQRGMITKLGTRTGIAGSLTPQLTLSGVQAGDSGSYYVVVKDQNGVSAQSKSAQVSVMRSIVPTRPDLLR